MRQPTVENPVEKRNANCEKHGPFVDEHYMPDGLYCYTEFWRGCPTCRGERMREEEEREERAAQKRLKEERVRAARIPSRFYSRTLADYKVTTEGEHRALLAASDYVEKFAEHLAAGRCLVFCGLPGTGKTHLACAVAKSLAEGGRRTRYFTVQELIRSIRVTWQPDAPETEDTVLQRLRALDLLVLDEVGVQFGTEAERTQLTEVMDLRYRDTKPTLAVSNCTSDELKKYLGDRIVDRLRENGGKIVIFDWPSRRGTHGSGPLSRNLEECPSKGRSLLERALADLADEE